MDSTRNEHMKEKLVEPYYGYRLMKYLALIAGGIVSIALAIVIVFTTTGSSILYGVLGVILLSSGAFGHLSMGWVDDPEKMELVKDNFSDLLRNAWAGKGKVLDIGTGLGRVAIEIAKRFPES